MRLPFSLLSAPRRGLAALAIFCASAVPPQESASEPWLELPDGPAAKAFAAIAPEAEEVEVPSLPTPPLSEPAGWEAWAGYVETAGTGTEGERARARAALLLLAREEGRAAEAWTHFVALRDQPRWSVTLISQLLPGVPAGTEILPGGAPGALPNGVLLKPTIPPAEPLPSGGLRGRKALVRGLQIGEAKVDFEITFDAYGVQIDLRWIEGEPTSVRVLMPQPEGYTVRVEYVDWMRQDNVGEERLVELGPETAEITLFGRILPSKKLYPRAEPGQLSRGLELSGFILSLPPNETETSEAEHAAELRRLQAAARGMARASGLQVALETAEKPVLIPGATLIRLPAPGPEREALLRWLVSAIEAHRLQL